MTDLLNIFINEFRTPQLALAQLTGLIPLVLAYLMFQFSDRRKIILTKTASDMLWALHFFLLGETSGAITNCVNTVRNILFAYKQKLHLDNWWIPLFFCLLTVISNLLTQDGIKCLFPMLGSCLAVLGFWGATPSVIRRYNFFATALWLVYGFITFSIPTILCNLLSIISILIKEIKALKSSKTLKAEK